MGTPAFGVQSRRDGLTTRVPKALSAAATQGATGFRKGINVGETESMDALTPVDDHDLTPGMAALVKRFKDDPGYVNGLKIFALQPKFAEIAWSAFTQLL